MRCTVQYINTLNFNAVRFCARHLSAHLSVSDETDYATSYCVVEILDKISR
jgi:phosphopantetheinyl transferase (holo-ACP synthase)